MGLGGSGVGGGRRGVVWQEGVAEGRGRERSAVLLRTQVIRLVESATAQLRGRAQPRNTRAKPYPSTFEKRLPTDEP